MRALEAGDARAAGGDRPSDGQHEAQITRGNDACGRLRRRAARRVAVPVVERGREDRCQDGRDQRQSDEHRDRRATPDDGGAWGDGAHRPPGGRFTAGPVSSKSGGFGGFGLAAGWGRGLGATGAAAGAGGGAVEDGAGATGADGAGATGADGSTGCTGTWEDGAEGTDAAGGGVGALRPARVPRTRRGRSDAPTPRPGAAPSGTRPPPAGAGAAPGGGGGRARA